MSLGTFDANKAENLPEIEKQMAVKCVEHAQTYWNLLEKIQPSSLRLTKWVPADVPADSRRARPRRGAYSGLPG